MKLRGKGYYIWQLQNCEGGSAKAIASKAKQAGLTHVLIKIADGASWAYNIDRTRDVDLVPPVLTALKSAGIQVWGWHYVRGDNPLGEARLGANRARSLGLDGYVIDAEREYKGSGKKAAAQRYAQELRRLLGNMPIALSSYRYPRIHYEIPYGEFLAVCDFAMPQVYFEHSHDPECPAAQVVRSIHEPAQCPAGGPDIPDIFRLPAGVRRRTRSAWRFRRPRILASRLPTHGAGTTLLARGIRTFGTRWPGSGGMLRPPRCQIRRPICRRS